jgi:hypothetical protein
MKKLMIVSLVAAAGLTVAACKKDEAAVAGSNVVDVAETDAMNGTTNDTMATNAVAGATNAVVGGATNAVAGATNAM